MEIFHFRTLLAFLLLCTVNLHGAVLYVAPNSPKPSPPYTDWSTAATNIQDAIDAAGAGDEVLVTNGVYATGGKVMAGDLTNRVALDKAITVQSVNGPWVTTIQGAWDPATTNGPLAVRCAWLTNDASLIGFTLKGGATRRAGDYNTLLSGGGIWSSSSNAYVINCIVESNFAAIQGGGAYQGTLDNCLVDHNTAYHNGGGTFGCLLNSCNVVSNSGAGVEVLPGQFLTNCIIYFNTPNNYEGAYSGAFSYCCTTPFVPGPGNIAQDPQLFPDGVHLTSDSPCRGAGNNPIRTSDIFGKPWAMPPSIGCAEWQPEPLVASPRIRLTGNPVGFAVGSVVDGEAPFTCLWMKDGEWLQNTDHYKGTGTTNLVVTGINPADSGIYQLVVSNQYGMATSAVATVVMHYVNAAGANPVSPYLSWQTAATNIQDAIDASLPGEIVLVTNGLYAMGGRAIDGDLTNRVTIDKRILVQSMQGAAQTVIQGTWDPNSVNGPSAVRCVWMTNDAVLSGFTLHEGATRDNPSSDALRDGGGVFGTGWNPNPSLQDSSSNAVVANCVIDGNAAFARGGGAFHVTLLDCTLSNNQAGDSRNYSAEGGGAYACQVNNCILKKNSARANGGGAAGQSTVLRNCAIMGNWADSSGDAAFQGKLVNCTINGNWAGNNVQSGGAVDNANLINCIVKGSFPVSPGTYNNYYGCTFSYCDTDPLAPGSGNIDLDPQLLADGYHLAPNSPCYGAGTASVINGNDIDGQAWNNPPSIGCDEWQPAPTPDSELRVCAKITPVAEGV